MSEEGTVPHMLRGSLAGLTRYDRAGQGQPVVLLHGLGMKAAIWAPQREALARDYDVVAPDMLGHGGSSLPPEEARLSDYSDQLLALLDGLGLGAAHLVGHSMGALIALDFALAHPQRVLSVAALNGVYCRSAEQQAAALQRAAALAREGNRASPDDTLARWFGDPVPPALAPHAATARAMLGSVDPVGYARTYRVFAGSDAEHRGRLERLAMPALFVTGELDPNSTPQMSRAMAAAAPFGRCEILAGERHMMTLTAPLLVSERIRAFHRDVAEGAFSANRQHTDANPPSSGRPVITRMS